MQDEVQFAGLQVSAEEYTIQRHVVQVIQDFPVPTDETAVRSFLGMCNELGPFNVLIAEATRPLYELTKDVVFSWTIDHEPDSQTAKSILVSNEVIAFNEPSRPLGLYTDASKLHGLGFVLQQQEPDRDWRPIMVRQ